MLKYNTVFDNQALIDTAEYIKNESTPLSTNEIVAFKIMQGELIDLKNKPIAAAFIPEINKKIELIDGIFAIDDVIFENSGMCFRDGININAADGGVVNG